eukprot:2789444-Lingulodinium_polyedra.AAC.1
MELPWRNTVSGNNSMGPGAPRRMECLVPSRDNGHVQTAQTASPCRASIPQTNERHNRALAFLRIMPNARP